MQSQDVVISERGRVRDAQLAENLRLDRIDYVGAVIADTVSWTMRDDNLVALLGEQYLVPASNRRSLVSLRPVVEVEGGGAIYDPESGSFRGSVLVGLTNSGTGGQSESLATGLIVQLVVDPGRADPTDVSLTHTEPPYERVEIGIAAEVDSATLRVITHLVEDGHRVAIPVRRPALRLSAPTPAHIDGFGLDRAMFQITAPAAAIKDSLAVAVSASNGGLETSTVWVHRGRATPVYLRSRGTDAAEVRVTAENFRGAQASVDFRWPIAFLVAVLLGSLVGTVGSHVKDRSSGKDVSLAAAFLGGLAAALIVAVLWTLGVNLLGLDLGTLLNEAVAFVLAAVASLLGVSAIHALLAGDGPG